jgi:hypothetical protein
MQLAHSPDILLIQPVQQRHRQVQPHQRRIAGGSAL